MSWEIRQGDCLDLLKAMPDGIVQTVVTSPPYWGLRDYGNEGQLGLEKTPDEYVQNLVNVFREVRRVLRDDGTVWLNLGDSYASSQSSDSRTSDERARSSTLGPKRDGLGGDNAGHRSVSFDPRPRLHGLKPKDLCGIPWRVAFALQADGWYLRSDIVWNKPNPMPESVTDRPTRSHEYIFLLTKSARYFYDADAVREDVAESTIGRLEQDVEAQNGSDRAHGGIKNLKAVGDATGRNKRSVWTVATQPYSNSHFATFPPKLIEPCILAGSAEDALVLDPFCGSGTTGLMALRHNRSFIGLELNPEYVQMARHRILDDAPLLNHGLEVAA